MVIVVMAGKEGEGPGACVWGGERGVMGEGVQGGGGGDHATPVCTTHPAAGCQRGPGMGEERGTRGVNGGAVGEQRRGASRCTFMRHPSSGKWWGAGRIPVANRQHVPAPFLANPLVEYPLSFDAWSCMSLTP